MQKNIFLRIARRIVDKIYDFYFGISTSNYYAADGHQSSDAYEVASAPYLVIMEIFRRLHLQDKDILIDVGCGTGRVVCMASRQRIDGAFGVELLEEPAKLAKRNLLTMRGKKARKFDIYTGNILNYDNQEANIYFLFNPFGKKTLSEFLKKIINNRDFSRSIRIVYYNPKHHDVMISCPGVCFLDNWRILGRDIYLYEINIESQCDS